MTPPPRARTLWPAAYSRQAQRTARRGDNEALTSKQCKYPHYQPLTLSNILAAVSNTIYHVSPEALIAFKMLALSSDRTLFTVHSLPFPYFKASTPAPLLLLLVWGLFGCHCFLTCSRYIFKPV